MIKNSYDFNKLVKLASIYSTQTLRNCKMLILPKICFFVSIIYANEISTMCINELLWIQFVN